MPKAKSSQAFSPAATRIYQAARTGITARTNPGHVKRVIDKELEKYTLSTKKIQKEIHDAVVKASAAEVKKTEKAFENQITELEGKVKTIRNDAKTFTDEMVKTATKELKDQVSGLEEENKILIKEQKDLIGRVNGLTEQNTELRNSITGAGDDPGEKPEPTGSDPKDDTSPDPDQEKKSSGKGK